MKKPGAAEAAVLHALIDNELTKSEKSKNF